VPDLSFAFRNLHSLSRAGIPLAAGCRKFAENSHYKLTPTWINLAESLESGQSLAEALRLSPLPVQYWMLDMIQAGENSGTTDQILNHLAEELETRRVWSRTLLTRLLYPAVVLHLTALLPALPLALNHGSGVALTWIIFFLALIYFPLAGVWLLSRAARQSPGLKQVLESLQLKIPILGPGLRAAMSARFYRALAALARASSRWEDAVTSSARASNSARLFFSAERYRESLVTGEELTATLRQFDFFTPQDIDMLNTGEITGTLDATLQRLSEASWETSTQRLKLFSVILTVGVYGLCIGGILLAMFSILGPVYYQVYELLNY